VTARILGRVLVVVVLVASGAYFLVYLYRWQWNRALISGLFFVAAEIAVVASVLLRRLQAIEDRIEERKGRPAPASPPDALEAIRRSAPPPQDHFAWLKESPSGTNVFIPVLLGAGVLLSGVATVVERIAGATAKPVLEDRLALRLQPLAMAAGGLLGAAAPVAVAPRRRGVVVGRVFAVVVAALLLYGAIDVIGDATQTRPDAATKGMTTSLVLAISYREAGRNPVATTEALWSACQDSLRTPRALDRDPQAIGLERARMVRIDVTPELGEHAQRRIVGCLEDATLAGVLAHLVKSSIGPSTSEPGQGEPPG
jgi:hypothetical protein